MIPLHNKWNPESKLHPGRPRSISAKEFHGKTTPFGVLLD
jgi:hypothetical protein